MIESNRSNEAALSWRLVIALSVTIIVLSGALVSRRANARPIWIGTTPASRESNWRRLDNGRLVIGSERARSTVVVFSDFDCAACRDFALILRELLQEDSLLIRVVFRHFVSPAHKNAVAAAHAAECAAAQQRFSTMHDALFDHLGLLGDSLWLSLARAAAIPDTAAFGNCFSRDTARLAAVLRDTELARALGISRAPTIVINGLRFGRPLDRGTLLAALRR